MKVKSKRIKFRFIMVLSILLMVLSVNEVFSLRSAMSGQTSEMQNDQSGQ